MIKWGWGSLMQIFVGGRNSAFPCPSSPLAPSRIESRRAMDVVRKVEDGDSVQWFSDGEESFVSE